MSQWGEINAEFYGHPEYLTIEHVAGGDAGGRCPHGSEIAYDSHEGIHDIGLVKKGEHKGERYIGVTRRLRGVYDQEDSFAVLAWWTSTCIFHVYHSTLTWELDSGPRYRYVYEQGQITKLRGVLDL